MQEVMQPYILPTQKPMMPDNSDNTGAILKVKGHVLMEQTASNNYLCHL
jgi:hypothetical protein